MASLLFKLYRAAGTFWLTRQTGWLGRFAQSAAFGPVMFTVLAVGFVMILAAIRPLVSDLESPWQDTAGYSMLAVAIVWILFMLLLIASRGATALHSTRHDDTPERLLARCKEMLEEHGFGIENENSTSFRAVRGKLGGWGAAGAIEKEWRIFPLEALVSVMASQSGTALNVRCTGMGGLSRSAREFTTATTRAIAELDGRTMGRLDRSVGVRQGGLFLGGLATSIFLALTICMVGAVALTVGFSYLAGKRAIEFAVAEEFRNVNLTQIFDLVRAIEAPLRADIVRLNSRLEKGTSRRDSAEEALKDLVAGSQKRNIVIGIRESDKVVTLLHPAEGHPLRAIVGETVSGRPPFFLRRAGDLVLRLLRSEAKAGLEKRLGLKPGQLVIGELFTHEDLARLAPKTYKGSELVFFYAGRPFARFAWKEFGKAEVDRGSAVIPMDVIVRQMELSTQTGILSALKDVILGDLQSPWGIIRNEIREGEPYRVFYEQDETSGAGTGWGGHAFAVLSSYAEPSWVKDTYQIATLLGSIGLLLVLFLTLAASTLISTRISRPVIEVRDALRSIAEGDYSVRVESNRTDEIGQLQKLLNQTAGELRKRESIKDLLGKYLSKQVADQILEGDSTAMVAGNRREVSILFADVRGFTTYAEQHDPEQVTKSLNEYFEVMVDVIAAHEGVLDKYIGDGLMVVFGAPMSQPDHARRAVITALEMQAALQTLNLKRMQRGDDPITIGIGVNTGVAISGNLGSVKRMEFTVIGDTVNLAARLENRADKGQILIGKATYEKVKDLIESEPLGQITVKGKTEPVDIWWLKGLKPRKR